MTTERGPGVPDAEELRERLAISYYGLRWSDAHSWGWISPEHKVGYYEVVDAILQEIDAAGFELVPVDILGRVVLELKEVNQSCDGLMFLSQDDVEAIGWVHPNCAGDLDAGEPEVGR